MKKLLLFRPSLLTSLRGYDGTALRRDILAGVITGIVALPLAIAFGIASGVSPEKGIVTAIVAGLIVSALGGSRVQIGGPTGAFIVIVSGIIGQYGPAGLAVATLMAGALLVLFGVLRLGQVIRYIPYPIVVGFTSGIALTIFTTQVKDLLGLYVPTSPSGFIEQWAAYAEAFGTIDPAAAAVGLVSVAVIAIAPKLSRRVPGSLIAIILGTVAAAALRHWWGIASVETIGDRFAISAAMPAAALPEMTWETVRGLVAPALTIAVLGAIESLLSATVADGVIGARHDSNTELIAQGVANIASPIFGGIPATGAIARTMTNITNGGRTPVAGIVHALTLLAIFLLLMPLAQYIPMATLAAVLVMVAYNMSGWRSVGALMRNPKSDVAVLAITFLLTVLFDLTVAIEVGLVIACLLFMRRMMETTDVRYVSDDIDLADEADMEAGDLPHLTIPEGVEVYEINGPFFFGAAGRFEEVMGRYGQRPKVRIIRMRKVPFVDSTGIHNLTNLITMSADDGVKTVLSGVQPKVEAQLHKAHFDRLIGQQNICPHIDIALGRAREIAGQKPAAS